MTSKHFQIFKDGKPQGQPQAGLATLCHEWVKNPDDDVVEVNAAGEPLQIINLEECREEARRIKGYD
jgi:hypothetical protein